MACLKRGFGIVISSMLCSTLRDRCFDNVDIHQCTQHVLLLPSSALVSRLTADLHPLTHQEWPFKKISNRIGTFVGTT